MREIKFRGLTANNEWVYGDLRHDEENLTFYHKDYSQRICWSNSNAPVKNGTVGQYTGLKNNYGQEIYEGDIVKGDDLGTHIGVVTYLSKGFKSKGICDSLGRNAEFDISFQVLGNIHENPELLKEESHE